LAPAKINLTLEVLGRRDDGYHTLRSVMVPIGLLDRIEFERNRSGAAVVVDAPQEIGADNLVSRALTAAGASGFDVRVTKNIPIGGGLGGGSSDAAAVLRAAMSGELGPTACDDWLSAARDLGSDVPFFLTGTAALVEGTGERVTALGALPDWWAVVVRPQASVPTAEAYRLLDASRAEAAAVSRPRNESASLRAVDALQRKDFAALQRELSNDFHEPILRAFPEIARADAALRSAAGNSLLSGSGSCLFALFEGERGARGTGERVDRASYEALFVVPFAQGDAWR
jgi:4-diphosphocytidyl-2-C-methyl-D-erythritol kinase